MSTCGNFSYVVERGCSLWPVHSLGETLLTFALLHFVLQGQTCLLLQVSLDFLLLHSSPLESKGLYLNHLNHQMSPMMKRTSSFDVFLEGLVGHHAAVAAKSLQSCQTLCDPIDGSPLGSPFPRILQTRTLEWIAISFSNVWKWKVKVKSLSHVRLLVTPWTTTYQAPLSMGFSSQEYCSELPLL